MSDESCSVAGGARPLVLVITADEGGVGALCEHLARTGFRTATAGDGSEALRAFPAVDPDLVLVDLLLPDLSGLEVCCRLRRRTTVPIVMVRSKDSACEPEVGLDLGADDYVTWPYRKRELVARLRAVLRRAARDGTHRVLREPIGNGDLHLDPVGYEVRVKGRAVQLLPKQYELLELLVEKAGRTVSKEYLAWRLWGGGYDLAARRLETNVLRLRRKVESDPFNPTRIMTVRGVGYRYEPAVDT
jgi:two-component system, OmpR family, response regulator RegX3